jgi:two-component system, NarL family, nitrate/nitrite response regulator NarL
MCRLAVLAPNSLLRAGVASLLKSAGFEAVETWNTIDDLRSTEERPLPDIVLASLTPNSSDIKELIEAIRVWAPKTKVVFLSSHLDLGELSECFRVGGSGFLLEDISADALQKSLNLVHAGERVFPSELATVLIDILRRKITHDAPELKNCDLSSREIGILRLLANGQSNKVIAAKLNLAESTTKLHLRNILRKLRASNRTQAALWAVRCGIADTEDGPPLGSKQAERSAHPTAQTQENGSFLL